jgi:hypothetical protein
LAVREGHSDSSDADCIVATIRHCDVFRRDVANDLVGDNWNRNRVALGFDVAVSKDAAD